MCARGLEVSALFKAGAGAGRSPTLGPLYISTVPRAASPAFRNIRYREVMMCALIKYLHVLRVCYYILPILSRLGVLVHLLGGSWILVHLLECVCGEGVRPARLGHPPRLTLSPQPALALTPRRPTTSSRRTLARHRGRPPWRGLCAAPSPQPGPERGVSATPTDSKISLNPHNDHIFPYKPIYALVFSMLMDRTARFVNPYKVCY